MCKVFNKDHISLTDVTDDIDKLAGLDLLLQLYVRCNSHQVNNRETKTVVGKELVTRKWQDVNVGDIVQLTNNEFVTVRI